MRFYDKIFAAYFSFYERQKSQTPRGTGITTMLVAQFTLVLTTVVIIEKITGQRFASFVPRQLRS
jgi:hypothetical protein